MLVLIAGRMSGRKKVVFLLQRRLLQSNCPQTISGVGEIRIRFLIISPVKAALAPMGEGEGLFSGANRHFRGAASLGRGPQGGVPRGGRKGQSLLSLGGQKEPGLWTLGSQNEPRC